MLQVLSEEEVKRMHDDMAQWVAEILESDKGTYLYNVLTQIKHMIEYMTESKIKWEDRHKLFMDGFKFAETQRRNNRMVAKINRINKKK